MPGEILDKIGLREVTLASANATMQNSFLVVKSVTSFAVARGATSGLDEETQTFGHDIRHEKRNIIRCTCRNSRLKKMCVLRNKKIPHSLANPSNDLGLSAPTLMQSPA